MKTLTPILLWPAVCLTSACESKPVLMLLLTCADFFMFSGSKQNTTVVFLRKTICFLCVVLEPTTRKHFAEPWLSTPEPAHTWAIQWENGGTAFLPAVSCNYICSSVWSLCNYFFFFNILTSFCRWWLRRQFCLSGLHQLLSTDLHFWDRMPGN